MYYDWVGILFVFWAKRVYRRLQKIEQGVEEGFKQLAGFYQKIICRNN